MTKHEWENTFNKERTNCKYKYQQRQIETMGREVSQDSSKCMFYTCDCKEEAIYRWEESYILNVKGIKTVI